MRPRIKGAVKVASSLNILHARYVYIQLIKIKKQKERKFYVTLFGRKMYITQDEARKINYQGVCLE